MATISIWNVAVGTECRVWRSWRNDAKHRDVVLATCARIDKSQSTYTPRSRTDVGNNVLSIGNITPTLPCLGTLLTGNVSKQAHMAPLNYWGWPVWLTVLLLPHTRCTTVFDAKDLSRVTVIIKVNNSQSCTAAYIMLERCYTNLQALNTCGHWRQMSKTGKAE